MVVEKKHELHLKISEKDFNLLKKIGQDRSCSVNWLIRLAVTSWLQRKGYYLEK